MQVFHLVRATALSSMRVVSPVCVMILSAQVDRIRRTGDCEAGDSLTAVATKVLLPGRSPSPAGFGHADRPLLVANVHLLLLLHRNGALQLFFGSMDAPLDTTKFLGFPLILRMRSDTALAHCACRCLVDVMGVSQAQPASG